MKKIKICILSCLSVFILTSCELNIVPDNIPTIEDHAFALRKEAEKVLFTCYRYMPSDGSLKNNVALLGAGDFCISDVFRSYLGTKDCKSPIHHIVLNGDIYMRELLIVIF